MCKALWQDKATGWRLSQFRASIFRGQRLGEWEVQMDQRAEQRGWNHGPGEGRRTKEVPHWRMVPLAKKRRPRPSKTQGILGPRWTDGCKGPAGDKDSKGDETKSDAPWCQAKGSGVDPGGHTKAVERACSPKLKPATEWTAGGSLEAETG